MDKDFPNGSGSWCPPEQIIEQKSNIDYNVGQRTDLEHIFSSAKNCTQPEQNNDSGAGANAGSREEMVFVTTDPLSELVWSPHKGLSLKCADCSLSDKKAFLWGMVLSPQHNNTSGEKNDIEPSAGGNVNPSPMLHQLDCKISDRVTLIGSSSSTKSVMPTCQTTNHEYKLGPGEVMKDLTKKDEEPVINSNHEYDHSDKKGKRVCVPIGLQSTETSRIRKKTDSSNPKKASIEGFDNGGTTDSSSTRLNEEKLSSERTNQECGDSEKGTSADPFEESRAIDTGNSHTAGVDSKSAYKPSASKQYKCSDTPLPLSTLACENREGLASIIQDDGMKIIPAAYSNALLEKEDSTSENDFEPLKGENASVEVGIASHPDNDLEHSGNQNGALPEDKIALIEASPINRRVPLILRKDKEKILSYSVANVETPNNDDDSHESIESCNNSKGLILSRKRPWSCDQQLAIENKKMKKQTFEDAHCTSVQKHGSSFMYWISNMVKGSSKSDLKETTSLDLVMKPAYDEHGGDDQHFMLQEKNQQSGCASTGFGTIFKSLYCSGRNVSSTGMSNIDHQLGKGLKEFELELDNKTYHSSSIPVTCSEENVKLCKETIVSTEYQAICEDGGGPSALPDIPSTNISVVREDPVKNRNLLRIPCDHGNNQQISSSSSFQIGLDFQSEKKESLKLCSSTANESSNFVISRSPPLGSLWITRFCPKVSPPVIDSSQCKQNNGASVEDPTGRIKILSSQNCVVAGKDQISCEDCQDPSTEDIFDAANRGVQNCIVNTAGSFGSIRVKEHTDQRFKSSINTIQPSQRSINSEAMTSVFARRLDALRHIVPSEVEGNIRHSSTPCIFCGIRGHKLQECSEITESELDALLRKVNSYDGAEESSCLCIRCFQLNHWAIACPKISSKNRSRSNGSSSLLDIRGFGKIVHTTRKDKVAYNAKRTLSDNMVRGDAVAVSVSDGKKPRVDTEVRDGNKKVSDEMIFNRSYSDSKLTKKDVLKNNIFEGDISREFIHRGKQTRTSSSTENVSKDYQITAIYNFVNRQIPAIPRGTFEAIKKLRLSRTEIFKWRRSPVSSFPLEGFFIRLRLRKSEKELGSTGYYVARLNGGLREKFSGSSKVPLSVKIGGFKCLVESRFVSNHDFLEDELLAWWCATLKGGGNLPSEKDLEMKLEQRKSFGF